MCNFHTPGTLQFCIFHPDCGFNQLKKADKLWKYSVISKLNMHGIILTYKIVGMEFDTAKRCDVIKMSCKLQQKTDPITSAMFAKRCLDLETTYLVCMSAKGGYFPSEICGNCRGTTLTYNAIHEHLLPFW